MWPVFSLQASAGQAKSILANIQIPIHIHKIHKRKKGISQCFVKRTCDNSKLRKSQQDRQEVWKKIEKINNQKNYDSTSF
jgi:hypothetical protein